jgi:hypothetical protein
MDGGMNGADPNELFKMFFGGGGPESNDYINLVFFGNMGGFPGGHRQQQNGQRSRGSPGGFTFTFK